MKNLPSAPIGPKALSDKSISVNEQPARIIAEPNVFCNILCNTFQSYFCVLAENLNSKVAMKSIHTRIGGISVFNRPVNRSLQMHRSNSPCCERHSAIRSAASIPNELPRRSSVDTSPLPSIASQICSAKTNRQALFNRDGNAELRITLKILSSSRNGTTPYTQTSLPYSHADLMAYTQLRTNEAKILPSSRVFSLSCLPKKETSESSPVDILNVLFNASNYSQPL